MAVYTAAEMFRGCNRRYLAVCECRCKKSRYLHVLYLPFSHLACRCTPAPDALLRRRRRPTGKSASARAMKRLRSATASASGRPCAGQPRVCTLPRQQHL